MSNQKSQNRQRRHARIRSKVKGTKKRPRLFVYKSLNNTFASLIDDENNLTIATFSDLNLKDKKATKSERAEKIGESIAKIAKEKKITAVVFDRGGYKYHGRVEKVAESARKAGLKF